MLISDWEYTNSLDQFFSKMCIIIIKSVSKRNLQLRNHYWINLNCAVILWTYRYVLYLIFLFSVNHGKGDVMVQRMWVWEPTEVVVSFPDGATQVTCSYKAFVLALASIFFLYWMVTWNSFPGRRAARALSDTHFTWCRGSEWVELIIYSTPCLHGVHMDSFLCAVPFNYFFNNPRSSYKNGEKWGIYNGFS